MSNPFSGYSPAAQSYWNSAKSDVSQAWNQLWGTPAADPAAEAVQGYEPPSVPFVFTSERRLADPTNISRRNDLITDNQALKYTNVTLLLNPKSISFKQSKRFARHDRTEGSTFHHFTNSNYENNDLLEIEFQGNTGLIVPLPGGPSLTSKKDANTKNDIYLNHVQACRIRLATWHSLYALTREPMLIKDSKGKSIVNHISITLATPALPAPITFKGHFKEVLKFQETADKPRSRNYSMAFTVIEIKPYNIFNHVMTSFDTFTRREP
jgi:hypothetical protein